MFIDYFKILGLSPSATDEEIKTAYRKLSKKFHPDLNEGDTYFQDRFREIQEAYEILGNREKRTAYMFQYNEFYRVATSLPEIEPIQEMPAKAGKTKWKGWLVGFILVMLLGTFIRQAAHEVVENEKVNNTNSVSSVSESIETPASEPQPEVAPAYNPISVKQKMHVFGVIYYSYYSPIDRGVYHKALVSDIYSPESVSEDEKYIFLDKLSDGLLAGTQKIEVSDRRFFAFSSYVEASKERQKVLKYGYFLPDSIEQTSYNNPVRY